jgi:dTDP-4-amino-4,6-dideoxygalactose transaminase
MAVNAMRSGRVSSGKLVRQFEREFASLMNIKHAVAVSTGTDADVLALAVFLDFGASRGDEVIVPALSFAATGNAVLHAGFSPVFVDIERETLNIDPDAIEAAITDRTVAILPVHLMGKPADMDRIMAIARRHRLKVVEDAAEAHGAFYKGRAAGTIGDIGAFSTYVAHIITTIEGGIVITDNSEYAEVVRSLRSHGRACKCEECVLNVKGSSCKRRFKNQGLGDIRFIFERIGYSSKMNELEAAVGLGNLDHYHDILRKRRDNLLAFLDGFREFRPYLETFAEGPDEQIGPHAMPAWIAEGAPFTRNEIVGYLERNGVDTRSLFQSMPTQCPGFSFLGHKLGEFPNAEYMGNNGFHLGVHHDMDKADVAYVLEIIRDFLNRYR